MVCLFHHLVAALAVIPVTTGTILALAPTTPQRHGEDSADLRACLREEHDGPLEENSSTATLPEEEEEEEESPTKRRLLRGRPRKRGSTVELFVEGSRFAAPAIVLGHSSSSSSSSSSSGSKNKAPAIEYDLLDAHTDERLHGVDSERVGTYEVYEDGMIARCNVGHANDAHEVPCAIATHTKRMSGLVLYRVSYLDGDDDALVHDQLPFSRVRRIRERRNGGPVLCRASRPR